MKKCFPSWFCFSAVLSGLVRFCGYECWKISGYGREELEEHGSLDLLSVSYHQPTAGFTTWFFRKVFIDLKKQIKQADTNEIQMNSLNELCPF